MGDTYLYINDQILPEGEAKISATNLSLLRGYGVFDYLRTYQGEPFHLEDHLKRLKNSARLVDIPFPYTFEEITQKIEKLLAFVPYQETSIKIVLTGGYSTDQLVPQTPGELYFVAYPFKPYPPIHYTQGIKIITTPFTRSFPEAKTTQYLPGIVALKKAAKEGAVDVLYKDHQNNLLETASANFFALKNNTLITPKTAILPGITRQIVLELAKETFAIEKRVIAADEIPTFDGAFLTSSNKEVMPIIQIDDQILNNQKIHPHIKALMEAFHQYTTTAAKK